MLPASTTTTSSPDNKRPKPSSDATPNNRLPRTCLILSLLSLQLLLLLLSRSLPRQQPQPPSRFPAPTGYEDIDSDDDENGCQHGKVFVYDVPKEFNLGLLEKCDKLNPWFSRCEAVSDRGFGPRAELGLPGNLSRSWYWTDQFALEIIFHNRMVNHRCRTKEPDKATAFYIPFYAGLAVGKYLWNNHTAEDRDRDCETVLKWVHDQPYWNRSNGWDHFLAMGRITWDFRRSGPRDWGSSCIHRPLMRNITRLLIERNSWDYFDIGVPYPTGFHPKTLTDLLAWQSFVLSRNRTTLFSFAGATRGFIKNDFRALLINQCQNGSVSGCRVVDCGGSRCAKGTSVILETFLDSDFCLQPRGDSFTRKSIFDCMVAGSIPVFFWKRTAYYQYEWFLPGDQESYSVYIDRSEVENGTSIQGVLEKFSREEVRRMREKVVEYIPSIVYTEPNKGLDGVKDAFDVAIEGVLRRMKEQEGGYKW